MSRINWLMANTDETAVTLLKALLTAMSIYATAVKNMEGALKSAQFRMEGQELREFTERLDRRRRQAHESLMACFASANRYIIKIWNAPKGGVFDGDLTRLNTAPREVVSEWALKYNA